MQLAAARIVAVVLMAGVFASVAEAAIIRGSGTFEVHLHGDGDFGDVFDPPLVGSGSFEIAFRSFWSGWVRRAGFQLQHPWVHMGRVGHYGRMLQFHPRTVRRSRSISFSTRTAGSSRSSKSRQGFTFEVSRGGAGEHVIDVPVGSPQVWSENGHSRTSGLDRTCLRDQSRRRQSRQELRCQAEATGRQGRSCGKSVFASRV